MGSFSIQSFGAISGFEDRIGGLSSSRILIKMIKIFSYHYLSPESIIGLEIRTPGNAPFLSEKHVKSFDWIAFSGTLKCGQQSGMRLISIVLCIVVCAISHSL
jgi:hypothetical protein